MLFAYGSQLAMGLALLRAQNLETSAIQLAVWDGEESSGRAGTSVDVRAWASRKRPTEIIDLTSNPISGTRPPTYAVGSDDGSRVLTAWKYGDVTRELHAIMFGDVVGFSHVPERLLPVFQRAFMARISETLDSFGKQVLYRNSWGDAVYAISTRPRWARAARSRSRTTSRSSTSASSASPIRSSCGSPSTTARSSAGAISSSKPRPSSALTSRGRRASSR
jgi:hypothetical protein